MMTIEKRISAFSELGALFRYITINETGLTNDLKSKFSPLKDKINLAIQNAEAYNGWFTKENIYFSLKNWAKSLNKQSLTNWISDYKFTNSDKRVAIVMAGNIPLVGFHDLLSVVLSGHNALVKTSSKDNQLITFIVNYLYSIDDNFKKIITLVERLENFDAVIATGSNNTARYFGQYFSKVPNIIRKNRSSVAVLNGKETKEELRALGEDVFRYFGLGCRNVTKIYFKNENQIQSFFESIIDWEQTLVNHSKYSNNYEYNRAIYLLAKDDFLDNHFLLLKKDKALHSPIGVVNYEVYSDIEDVKSYLEENQNSLQCVIGNELTENSNHVKFGQSQTPSLIDYADKINTLKFLSEI